MVKLYVNPAETVARTTRPVVWAVTEIAAGYLLFRLFIAETASVKTALKTLTEMPLEHTAIEIAHRVALFFGLLGAVVLSAVGSLSLTVLVLFEFARIVQAIPDKWKKSKVDHLPLEPPKESGFPDVQSGREAQQDSMPRNRVDDAERSGWGT
jgi:hypothetical protein